MTLLAAILQDGQNVAEEGDLLRHHRPGEENGRNHQQDHCLYYIRASDQISITLNVSCSAPPRCATSTTEPGGIRLASTIAASGWVSFRKIIRFNSCAPYSRLVPFARRKLRAAESSSSVKARSSRRCAICRSSAAIC